MGLHEAPPKTVVKATILHAAPMRLVGLQVLPLFKTSTPLSTTSAGPRLLLVRTRCACVHARVRRIVFAQLSSSAIAAAEPTMQTKESWFASGIICLLLIAKGMYV